MTHEFEHERMLDEGCPNHNVSRADIYYGRTVNTRPEGEYGRYDDEPEPFPIRPLGDRLVVKWDDLPEQAGRIIIPEAARRPGVLGGDQFLRTGVVVAKGPGDKCGAPYYVPTKTGNVDGGVELKYPEACLGTACPKCHGTGYLPMFVSVGDRVLYDHPSSNEVPGYPGFVIIHAEQHILGVLG